MYWSNRWMWLCWSYRSLKGKYGFVWIFFFHSFIHGIFIKNVPWHPKAELWTDHGEWTNQIFGHEYVWGVITSKVLSLYPAVSPNPWLILHVNANALRILTPQILTINLKWLVVNFCETFCLTVHYQYTNLSILTIVIPRQCFKATVRSFTQP